MQLPALLPKARGGPAVLKCNRCVLGMPAALPPQKPTWVMPEAFDLGNASYLLGMPAGYALGCKLPFEDASWLCFGTASYLNFGDASCLCLKNASLHGSAENLCFIPASSQLLKVSQGDVPETMRPCPPHACWAVIGINHAGACI
eukprot:1146321-Pelagomonas_calceolata.AAC.9